MAVVTTNVRHILSFQTVFKSKGVFFCLCKLFTTQVILFDRTDGIIPDYNQSPENSQNYFFLLVLMFSFNKDHQKLSEIVQTTFLDNINFLND